MPELRYYNIFISHAWKYGDAYERLEKMLRSAPNFQFLNWSAPSDKPLIPPGTQASDKNLRTKIRDKIKMADCVLVLGGMYAAHSDWMQAEIDIAKALPRTIIGIRPRGNKPYPTNILVASKVDVNWSTSSIVEAIRSNARPR